MSMYFTRKGDSGTTGIIGGQRVSKTSPVFTVISNGDTLLAEICILKQYYTNDILDSVCRCIYRINAYLAGDTTGIPGETEKLETYIKSVTDGLRIKATGFILPDYSLETVYLNKCRCVSRVYERSFLDLSIENLEISSYLNRLSSLFYILCLDIYDKHGVELKYIKDL